MDTKKSNGSHLTLGVIPFVANKAQTIGQNTSHLARVDEDPKEHKRKRERERFASMSEERRNELNKKRRELYQRKKEGKKTDSLCKEVIDPTLLRNERDRARRALMPSNKREEINKKRRELYQRKKEQLILPEPNHGGEPSGNKENEDPANYDMLREKKCIYSRQWYKNMPPEKRKARQERERLYNSTIERKEAKKASYRGRKEYRANTLHPDSIAMKNPMYTPSP